MMHLFGGWDEEVGDGGRSSQMWKSIKIFFDFLALSTAG